MSAPRKHIEALLRNWKGEDSSNQTSAAAIADEIDREYLAYLQSLPQRTAVINLAQQTNERRLS